MPTLRLYVISYSPWSEKARWALDHHAIAYREIEHTPMLGEPRLRLAARRFRGRVSVPTLVTPHGAITDSFEIAAFADRTGRGAPLGFATKREELQRWNARSETLLFQGRAHLVERMMNSPGALAEALPRWVPDALRPAMRPVARVGTAFVRAKYAARIGDRQEFLRAMREPLDALRASLDTRHGYVTGSFGYADIAMAVALQAVDPVDDSFLRLGPASREAWRNETLAHEYRDLLRWRDELYTRHRRATARAT